MSPDGADAKLLDRIAKLLRLATNNPSIEEARTAALQAAKLIVEHKFLIGRAAAPRPPAAPYPAPDPYTDFAELLRRQAAAQQAQAQQQAQREAWRQAVRQDFAEPVGRAWFHEYDELPDRDYELSADQQDDE